MMDFEYVYDLESQKGVLLYFSDDHRYCGIQLDANVSKMGEVLSLPVPNPLRSYEALVRSLGIYETAPLSRNLVVRELLALYVRGLPFPSDGETGIERYYREHPEVPEGCDGDDCLCHLGESAS